MSAGNLRSEIPGDVNKVYKVIHINVNKVTNYIIDLDVIIKLENKINIVLYTNGNI